MKNRQFGRKLEFTRRKLLKIGFIGGAAMFIPWNWKFKLPEALAEIIPGGTLDPLDVAKFVTPMLIPPVMPRAGTIKMKGGMNADYYEISMIQKSQQILPDNHPATTVWAYGATSANKKKGLLLHNAPSLTIEARHNRPTRIKWTNDLVDGSGNYLPHLLPVDPTLHWANPGGPIDTRPDFTGKVYVPTYSPTEGSEIDTDIYYTRYWGPVPMVTHVHGAVGVGDESDGYPEAWYLPNADNITDYTTQGTWYDFFSAKADGSFGVTWGSGYATFQYPNKNRASTIWYHDHTLGMTRLNVYAGPAGFYLIRGGPDGDDAVIDSQLGTIAVLPGPAPKENDMFPPNKTYYEIPIAIQDRAFNEDGSLFYPDSRKFFDELASPYIPAGEFSPVWNPEFFGNMIMVNGNTWPFQTVEKRRYRLRFLNGCQSRFLILDFSQIPEVEVWMIGNEGGFLAAPVNLTTTNDNKLLMALAERADLIVDFTNVPEGNYVLGNVGPDEPFGGLPIDSDAIADPSTTGQIMQFRVVQAVAADPTTPPQNLQLPAITPLPSPTVTRKLALIEEAGFGVDADVDGEEVEGPVEALLGVVDDDGKWIKKLWMDQVTENPTSGATEEWEIYNTTGDAHPMHVHEVVFEVINRQEITVNEDSMEVALVDFTETEPEPWETGFKDMVIAYPEQVTRIRATFSNPGQFVWHCHIVEHEDNEMMRPYRIGPVQPGQPGEEDMA